MKNNTATTKTSTRKTLQKHIVNVLKKDNQQRKVKKTVKSFAQGCVKVHVDSAGVPRLTL